MAVLRKRIKHYAKLPSSTIRDSRLYDGSLGLLIRIVDLPDNWVVRADTLAAGRPQGRDATARCLRNLAACGYYRVERRKLRNGRFQMGTAISDESVPQWEAEYEEFGGKPIPLVEQLDGTFKVRRKSGRLTDDGFVGEYAPGANDLPCPANGPGQTGNGFPVSGQDDHGDLDPETDISGHGFSGSGEPASGDGGPFSTTEKYGREVPAGADVGDQLPVEDDEIDHLRAVGAFPTVTRAGDVAPTAKQDQLSADAWKLATLLPRRYREALPPELRFPMVALIRRALVAGIGGGAVLRYAEMCHADNRFATDRHVPLLRHALGLLHQDTRLGLVCPACGTEPSDGFGPPCERCRPMPPPDTGAADDLEGIDPAELAAARAFLDPHGGDLAPMPEAPLCDTGDDGGALLDPTGPTPALIAPAAELTAPAAVVPATGIGDDTGAADDGEGPPRAPEGPQSIARPSVRPDAGDASYAGLYGDLRGASDQGGIRDRKGRFGRGAASA